MGGFHVYCSICGCQAEVARRGLWHSIENTILEHASNPALHRKEDVSESVQAAFSLDQEDVAFQEDLILIGPYDSEEQEVIDQNLINRGALPPDDDEVARLAAYPADQVRIIRNLVPGDMHDLGSVERHRNGQIDYFNVGVARVYAFTHATCFHLLSSFSNSRITAGVLWSVYRASDPNSYLDPALLEGIDYFEIGPSISQYVWPMFEWDTEEKGERLHTMLNKSEPDLEDARYFFMEGKIWVFVAPDKFPAVAFGEGEKSILTRFPMEGLPASESSSKLASLPPDLRYMLAGYLTPSSLLNLLATSREIRHLFWPFVDYAAKQEIALRRPWLLPQGDEETKRWQARLGRDQATKGGGLESPAQLPWMVYLRKCLVDSASMMNRERIWKIVKQIEARAGERGWI